MKRAQPKRDWTAAREKVDEASCCRVCGVPSNLQAAHIDGRKYDKPRGTTKILFVDPDRIVPLCGDCHREYDAHELDLLPYLTTTEQVAVVRAMGGIEIARNRVCGNAVRRQFEGAA
jgi:hypothetical protein